MAILNNKMSTEAYRKMLVAQVAAGKLSHRKAKKMFDKYIEIVYK